MAPDAADRSGEAQGALPADSLAGAGVSPVAVAYSGLSAPIVRAEVALATAEELAPVVGSFTEGGMAFAIQPDGTAMLVAVGPDAAPRAASPLEGDGPEASAPGEEGEAADAAPAAQAEGDAAATAEPDAGEGAAAAADPAAGAAAAGDGASTLSIPASVEHDGVAYEVAAIGAHAFSLCEAATVAIPASVASIDEDALWPTAAQRVEVDAANPTYASYDGILYDASLTRLLSIPEGRQGAVRIIESAQEVEASALSHSVGVDALCADAGGAHLASWDGLLYTADGATLLRVPAAATSITIRDGCTAVAPSAFEGCAALERIEAPATVVDVSPSALGSGALAPDPAGVTVLLQPGVDGEAWSALGLRVEESAESEAAGTAGAGSVPAGIISSEVSLAADEDVVPVAQSQAAEPYDATHSYTFRNCLAVDSNDSFFYIKIELSLSPSKITLKEPAGGYYFNSQVFGTETDSQWTMYNSPWGLVLLRPWDGVGFIMTTTRFDAANGPQTFTDVATFLKYYTPWDCAYYEKTDGTRVVQPANYANFLWSDVDVVYLTPGPSVREVLYYNDGTSTSTEKWLARGWYWTTSPSLSRKGYISTGWWTASSGGTKYCDMGGKSSSIAYSSVTARTVRYYYAQWRQDIYTVILDSQLWSSSTAMSAVCSATSVDTPEIYYWVGFGWYDTSHPTEETQAATTAMELIAPPTLNGYAYGGYYTGKAGTGTQKLSGQKLLSTAAISQDAVWYAKWTINPVYTITLNSQLWSYSTATSALCSATTAGTTAIYYWTGVGWFNVKKSQGAVPTGGAATSTALITQPTLSGYTYQGYWTGKVGTGTQKMSGTALLSIDAVAANAVWYVKWYKNPVFTVYLASDPSYTGAHAYLLYSGSTITGSAGGNTFGYTFSIWPTVKKDSFGLTTQDCFYFSADYYTAGKSNPSSYAIYDIAYVRMGNGAIVERPAAGWALTEGSTADIYVTPGTPYKVTWKEGATTTGTSWVGKGQSVLSPELADRTGYAKGWFTSSSGGTKVSEGGDQLGPVTADATYYSRYVANRYAVELDANGEGATVSPESLECAYDEDVALPTPERYGYAFLGWDTERDGTGTRYQAGVVRNLAEEDGATVALYAQWALITNVELPITAAASVGFELGVPDGSIRVAGTEDDPVERAEGWVRSKMPVEVRLDSISCEPAGDAASAGTDAERFWAENAGYADVSVQPAGSAASAMVLSAGDSVAEAAIPSWFTIPAATSATDLGELRLLYGLSLDRLFADPSDGGAGVDIASLLPEGDGESFGIPTGLLRLVLTVDVSKYAG